MGQAVAQSLLSLTSDDSIFGPDSTNAAPAEPFSGLSLVESQAVNAPQGEPQLQLQTEDSQFLQYCLDPANGILPQDHPSVPGPALTPAMSPSPASVTDLRGSAVSQRDEPGQKYSLDMARLPVSVPARAVTQQDVFDSRTLAQPLSPRSQLHATAQGSNLFYPAGEEVDECAGSAEGFVEHGLNEPASIHADQGMLLLLNMCSSMHSLQMLNLCACASSALTSVTLVLKLCVMRLQSMLELRKLIMGRGLQGRTAVIGR